MELDYPVSLGVYDWYVRTRQVGVDALSGAHPGQQAVDYLTDPGFPVMNLEIVGTELRSIERVTGRLTRGKIAAAGTLSGLWIGLFVGIAFSLFSDRNRLGFLLTTPLLMALFGLAWSQLGYSTATRHGTRDFASVNQVVATKYEVLVEHKHAAGGQELLANMPREVTIGHLAPAAVSPQPTVHETTTYPPHI